MAKEVIPHFREKPKKEEPRPYEISTVREPVASVN
jgi:hypothetical protein